MALSIFHSYVHAYINSYQNLTHKMRWALWQNIWNG